MCVGTITPRLTQSEEHNTTPLPRSSFFVRFDITPGANGLFGASFRLCASPSPSPHLRNILGTETEIPFSVSSLWSKSNS